MTRLSVGCAVLVPQFIDVTKTACGRIQRSTVRHHVEQRPSKFDCRDRGHVVRPTRPVQRDVLGHQTLHGSLRKKLTLQLAFQLDQQHQTLDVRCFCNGASKKHKSTHYTLAL